MNRSRVTAVILRHLFEMKHNWFKLSDIIFWPMIDLTLWGFMTIYLSGQNPSISPLAATFLGGIILWWLYFRIQQDVALSFLTEVWDRNVLNLFTTPLTMREYFTGTMLLGLLKIVITATVLAITSHFFFHSNSLFESWAVGLLVANLILTGWTMGVASITFLIRYGTRAEYMVWWLPFLIQPFSAVTIPLEKLPHWMQLISAALPTTHVFEGLRAIILHHEINYQNILLATVLNIFYFVLATFIFSIIFKKVKEKGILAKLS